MFHLRLEAWLQSRSSQSEKGPRHASGSIVEVEQENHMGQATEWIKIYRLYGDETYLEHLSQS